MSTEHKGADFFVGLFLLIGFAIIAMMVLVFGRVSQGGKDSYPLKVEFPNASGLIKGCQVFLSGALVGSVAEPPRLVDDNYTVAVLLQINEGIQIPRKSTFQIRTAGMLGDAYVDVVPPVMIPPSKFTEADFAEPGELIKGQRVPGLDDLTAKGGMMIDTLNTEILRKLSAELDQINTATTSINERLLSEKNLKNLEEAFANLKEATDSFADTSKKLDSVVAKVEDVAKLAENTMKGADGAVAEVKLTLADFREAADATTKTVGSARLLINKVAQGDGPLGMLISDRQTAADLKALITNMRRSGVLFYKDRPAAPAAPPALRQRR